MQLHLETEELNLIADSLLERIGRASAQVVPSAGSQPDESPRLGPHFFDELLDKILARDLRLDGEELEELGNLLSAQKRKLTEQIVQPGNPAQQTELQRKLRLLNGALERVNEACVMF